MPLGVYISVPFCRSKCSYCNFASGVFSREMYERYVDKVCADIARAPEIANFSHGSFETAVDSIYLGGGTPTVLDGPQLERIFRAVRQRFDVQPDSEVTVECAPGTLTDAMLETLLRCGVNRVSLGVQSFVDRECAAVGRLHTAEITHNDIQRFREAGITNINLDLIAGLPHQASESWRVSVDEAIATGTPHLSVYMLEVDDDSRLGRELTAGGTRYHAHFVPNEDLIADLYLWACERLNGAGVQQYEISNFAREGWQSRHNLKYWTRDPYFGFGLDAHSMLRAQPDYAKDRLNAVRFGTYWEIERFLEWTEPCADLISETSALEETFFLGLRLNRGVRLADVEAKFGKEAIHELDGILFELLDSELCRLEQGVLKLTPRGRLLSNEVFEKFVSIGTLADLPDILGWDPDDPRRATLLKPEKIQ